MIVDALGGFSTPTDFVEPRISFFDAMLHSPAAADIMYGLWVAMLLSAASGLILRRWWHGAIAIPLITVTYVAFLLLIPVYAYGASFELPPLREIGTLARDVSIGLAVVFVLTFCLRWVAVRAWHWIVSPPRAA